MNLISRTVTVSLIGLCSLAATAQVTSTSTVTGPNGQTATRSTIRGGGNVQSTITGPNGQTGTRNVSRTTGVDQRDRDWPQWAERNPQHHLRRREFTNNSDRPQWRRGYPQRLWPGHWDRYGHHDRTTGCDRHKSTYALDKDSQPKKNGLAPDQLRSEASFVLEEETALHHDYTAGDRRLLG